MTDLVLHGGAVFDGEQLVPGATAVAVEGGRVVAVGSDCEVRAAVGAAREVVDLRGRVVLPGFTDAHAHPVQGGVERLGCDLTGAASAQDELARVRAYADAHPDLPWVVGGGWLKEHFEGGLPTAAALDEVVPDRPVMLRDNSHHAVWVNSAALRIAGASSAGTLHEDEMDLVTPHLPPETLEEQVAGLLEAQRYLHSLGVTGWQDAIVGDYAGHPDPTDAYLQVATSGRLTARVVGALWWPRGVAPDDVGSVVDDLVARRRRVAEAVPDGRFRATSVKIMQDGVVESRTAGLLEPYVDAATGCRCGDGVRGLSYVAPDLLREVAVRLAREGFQLHLHAIGDRAVREALDALETALADAAAPADLRHHVAHLQVVHPHEVPRFGALGVIANLQALWACHEPAMDDLNIPILGPERSAWQYPFGDLVRSGAPLAMGSDWPVSSPNPFEAIQVAVTRREPGSDRPALLPAQAIDVRTALSAYTLGSARVNHRDDAGRVRVGALADLVVLDRDPLAVPPDELADVGVDLTLVDGVPVHTRP
ncbi:amidohydrolase [Angustibacter sp. Root456]|uniref:amidohydrolase n=1 Tax=Angustibacter sp. Root456 TaxID=1736539 RepID=UPI000B2281CC|nr:amidohydrolase [Angustibacter sp. Root456]